ALLASGWALLGRAATHAGPSGTPGSPTLGSAGSTSSASSASLPAGSPGSAQSGLPGGSIDPTVVLVGAGDIADCDRPGAQQTSDLLLSQVGSIFTAGDNAYPDGTVANYADCYGPTWGRVRDRIVLPSPGNHDWHTDGAAGYLGYFGSAAAPTGTTWYSRDLGNWHVVVLDSSCAKVGGCDGGSPQGRWLKRDLAASAAHCTLAIWHHPRFSSGEHGNDPIVAPFWDELHAAGAELIVNGHDHDYERFAPQDPSGAVERPGGLREIVVGTGGGVLRAFRKQVANSEFRQAGVSGVLRLTLHPVNYDWEFLPVNGDVADSGSTPCH
ncbi:MAG: metallophosphoesterase, partial [Candidatus Limnocylindrales bacterium]